MDQLKQQASKAVTSIIGICAAVGMISVLYAEQSILVVKLTILASRPLIVYIQIC